jgi:hypothetical protein
VGGVGGGGREGQGQLTGIGSGFAPLDVRNRFRIAHNIPQSIACDYEPAVVGCQGNFVEERLRSHRVCSRERG